nr:hypothetical protein [Candidatus Sigynarchaeota archaeon]
SIKGFFGDWFENVDSLNASLHAWNTTLSGFAYGTTSENWSTSNPEEKAWKEHVAKEWYAIKANYNISFAGDVTFTEFVQRIETEFTTAIPLPGDAPAFIDCNSWANATPEEIMIVLNTQVRPVNSLWVMQFMYRDQNGIPDLLDTTVTEIIDYVLGVLIPAKDELEVPGRDALTITYNMSVDLDVSIDADDVAVIIIWDDDNSLAEFVADLKAHRIPRSQPFTGDEIMYMVHFNKIVTTITGNIMNSIDWKYNDNTGPEEFINALRIVTRNPFAAQLIAATAGIPVNLFRLMLYGNVSITGGSRTFTDSTFSMAQLKVNQLRFSLTAGGGIEADTVDAWYAEHKMVGL